MLDARSRQVNEHDMDRESMKSYGSIHSKASQFRHESKYHTHFLNIFLGRLPLLFIDVNLGKEKGM